MRFVPKSSIVPMSKGFRVVDQSNRRWAYGFIRMAPFLMYVAGICTLVLLAGVLHQLRPSG